jgi:hypothetical protein
MIVEVRNRHHRAIVVGLVADPALPDSSSVPGVIAGKLLLCVSWDAESFVSARDQLESQGCGILTMFTVAPGATHVEKGVPLATHVVSMMKHELKSLPHGLDTVADTEERSRYIFNFGVAEGIQTTPGTAYISPPARDPHDIN